MSTVPSLSQSFDGVEDKQAQIRDLENKLAKLKLDVTLQNKATEKVDSPLPKPVESHQPTPPPSLQNKATEKVDSPLPKPVESHPPTPPPSLSTATDTPDKFSSGELASVTTSSDGVMIVESPYRTALDHIKNLPDGELKTAMMALCEASMVSPQVWYTSFMIFMVATYPSHKAWISRLTDLLFFSLWSM